MDSMVHVGTARIENVEELGSTITDIIEGQASDQVKIEALKALSKVAKVENITLSHCTFTDKNVTT